MWCDYQECKITHIHTQLQTLVSDENCYQVMECYSAFVEQLSPLHARMEARVTMETAYQSKVETLLSGENCFKIIFVSKWGLPCKCVK